MWAGLFPQCRQAETTLELHTDVSNGPTKSEQYAQLVADWKTPK